MARPRKVWSAEEEAKKAEGLALKKKAGLDAAVNALGAAREKVEKENRERLPEAAARSK